MAESQARATPAQRHIQYARPLSALGAPLQRAIAQLDSALIARLSEVEPDGGPKLARLEALLLWRARTGLIAHHRDHSSPERVDPVVAEALLEAIDFAGALVAELGAKGLARLARLWQGCREVMAELSALGLECGAEKQDLMRQRQLLTEHKASLVDAEQSIVRLGGRLLAHLQAQEPARARSPLEQLLTQPG